MPMIPTFENDVQVHPGGAAHADPEAFGAAGRALARAGEQIGDPMQQFNERYRQVRQATDLSNTNVQSETGLQDLSHKAGMVPDRAKAFAQFNDGADALYKKTIDPIQDPEVKAAAIRQFGQSRIHYGLSAQNEGFKNEASTSTATMLDQVDQLSHSYAAARNDFERASILDTAKQAITSRVLATYIDAETGEKLFKNFRSRADDADATRDINTDPAAAKAKLLDDQNYPNLDELTRGRLIGRAESKMQGRDAVFNASVRQRFDDNLASIQTTGQPASALSEPEIRQAFPGQADEMVSKLHLANGIYQANQAITLTSPQQDQALIGKWQPRGAGFADQQHAQDIIGKAIDDKWKSIHDDPAAYVMSAAPEVQQAFAGAAQDPRKTSAAMASIDAAYDKLGLAPQDRHLLTKDAAYRLAGGITANPAQAPDAIKQMQAQYGQYWPRAWNDLVKVGKLPVAYQAMSALDDPNDQQQLSRWLSQQKPEQSVSAILGEKNVAGIKNSVRSDPGVQSLVHSLAASGSSANQTSDVLDAIDNLAYAKSYFAHSPNAVQDAIKAFTDKYEFMPQGGARVPKARFDDVSAVASQTLHGLTADKITVPPVYGRPGMPQPDEFLDLVKASPNWITSPNADALWLKDPYGRIVRTKQGMPLAIPFTAKPAAEPSMIGKVIDALTPGDKKP